MGKFFLNMMASLNQMERDLISERTRDALRLKIAKHERAGQIPYGWRLTRDGRTLAPDGQEQAAISLILALREQRYSYRAICRELEDRAVLPWGRKWHPKTIGNILRKIGAH